ncbi:MAG: polysaccharide deacetylase family protein [Flavobacteriales bacterium]|jgi:peptidoglycan/xylan/chitin deacetylase (PgdA/CDA1 family)|nr:polysaccharide deacetylase family protein [Flavobacteriales bacterium]
MIWKKVKYKLKWSFNDLQAFLGVPFSINNSQGEVRVLCFHGVCKDEQDYINGRFIKESHLKRLLIAIKKQFHVITMKEYMNKEFNQQKLNVLLTFDDGYKNNKTLLLPIIEELKLPVTLFVLARGNKPLWTDLLDICYAEQINLSPIEEKFNIKSLSNQDFKRWVNQQAPQVTEAITKELEKYAQPMLSRYKEFWQLLSKNELIEINESEFVTLCNHTVNHYNLLLLDKKQLEYEVQTCTKYLEEIRADFPKVIAFPFGYYNSDLCDTLEALNYPIRFSITEGINTDEKAINRLAANPFVSVRNQLISIVNGKY